MQQQTSTELLYEKIQIDGYVNRKLGANTNP